MRKGIITISIFSLILMISACGPHIPEEKLSKIDELEKMLDSADQRISAIDSAEVFGIIEAYQERLEFYQNTLKDTLPRDEATFVDSWFRMRKLFAKFSSSYTPIMSELTISQQQLKDLRFDAENGLLEEKHFDEYIELERINAEKVAYATHDIMETMEKLIPIYHKKIPRVDSLQNLYKEQMSQE